MSLADLSVAPIAPDALSTARKFVVTGSTGALATATLIGHRRLVYVHGICQHSAGFSDPWWTALHPFVPSAFGSGELGQSRFEVLWSDIVNVASAMRAAALTAAEAGPAVPVSNSEPARRQTAADIKEALRDRADHHVLSATADQ